MIPIRARIKAATMQEFGSFERHGGEEFLIVLERKIEVHTEFYAPVTLQRGEGIYLDSTMGHAYLSAGDVDAEAFAFAPKSCGYRIPNNHVQP